MAQRDTTWGTERLGALSDGVFAIVLTLLVLDLKLPDLPRGYAEQEMIGALADRVPNLVAWVISFFLVARIWIVHHGIIANLARCHRGTITWNFILLGICSLVPFGSGLIGAYEWDPLAIALFSLIFGASGLALGLLARHAAVETHLHHERTEPALLRRQWLYHAIGLPAIALVSILFVFVATFVSLGIWLLEPLIALSVERWSARRRRQEGVRS
jgi:uncharacterized membrane protein